MNVLNPENKSTIQNHAIKLYSKVKIKKGKTLEKFGKPYVKKYNCELLANMALYYNVDINPQIMAADSSQ